MPVDDALLRAPNNRHIKINETLTLMEAFDALKAAKGHSWWHMIIEYENKTWAALRFSDLDLLALRMGPDFFSTPISDLPLNASLVNAVEKDSIDTENAKALARESLGRLLVITRNGQCVGIISVGGARGELFAGSTASELYGELADLSEDARLRYQVKAPPPTCPHCGQQSYQKYDVEKEVFICRNCGKIGG